jgi:hypothetical protein
MTLHLIKLCVGAACVSDLAERQIAMRKGARGRLAHRTRQTPRRAPEILKGGSIYWVISGAVCVRQRIVGIEAATGDDGVERCDIVLDPRLIATARRTRRPFQGWRYLPIADAPPDLTRREDDPGDDLMRATLLELGLI